MTNMLPDALGATLSLAAAPTFATMALWTAWPGQSPMAFCGAAPGGGMAMMYALMGAFHLAPWLRLVGRDQRIRT